MNGVKIGNFHSYDDFGLILSSKEISPPEPQTKMIEVPLRNGAIDLSDSLTGDIRYKNRKITMTFSVIDPVNTWVTKLSTIENYIHGKRMQIIFDDDLEFYYYGRISVNKFVSSKTVGTLVIEADVDPYKYDILPASTDWEWDPFDFETGIINAITDVTVNGSKSVVVVGRKRKICPTITSSAAMTVSFLGHTYNLIAGTNKIYEILLSEGNNTLTFTGTGTVSINYTGGSL